MSKVDKKLQAMKTNPKADWKMDDLKSLAHRYGIDYKQPGSSHVTFRCYNGAKVTVPASRPPGKEEPFWGQVKYLMHFGVRKLRVFLGFYFTDSLKPDKKYYPKCRHLHL